MAPARGGARLPYGRLWEAAALLLFAGSLFLVLSLASYAVDPLDPRVVGGNWVGAAGAAVAGSLVRAFGIVAWLLPLELVLVGAPLFRGRKPENLPLRLAGDLVVAIVLAALVEVAAPGATAFGKAAAAGDVGLLFGELMQEFFSTIGSFLVGPTVVGLILIGRSSFSFIELSRRTAETFRRLALRLVALVTRLTSAWKEARALGRAERRAELDKQAASEPADPDAALLLQLDEGASESVPGEQTGPLPLAVSNTVRHRSRRKAEADAEPASPTKENRRETSAPEEEEAEDEGDEGEEECDVEEAAETEGEASKRGRKRRRAPSSREPATHEPQEAAEAKPKPAEPRAKRRNGPEIVDTEPERAVERALDAPAVRVRDDFQLPSFDLLDPAPTKFTGVDEAKLRENSALLVKTLLDYGVQGTVEAILPGPTVTMYEVSCSAGTKVSKVAALADDLALGLSRKVRIIAPIPGKNRIGFELPNDDRIPVNLRELVEDQRFDKMAEKAPLPVVLGRDIVGKPFYADLASMPHVIVAGATGAGKSVGLNVMLSSLLFKRTPQELRLLMVDPKVVELAPYADIPHMLLPVVTDMKQAATALRWAVDEMERRYQLFANAGTKNIVTYNAWVKRVHAGEAPAPPPEDVAALSADGAVVSVPPAREGSDGRMLPGKLPYIVVVVDEFADLMMQQGKEVESSVARLAQKARAAGMHVVLATQRPSVDVITGMIKANFPTRIAFRVAQKVDSRTILDEQGAEHLLGRGDMLIKLNGSTETYRVQCPFVSEEEVSRLTDFLRTQGTPQYHDAILQADRDSGDGEGDEELDPRFEEAARIVAETQRCSTSWLQRKMTIGYNRAAKIVEAMEKRGMVGPPNGARDREVFLPPP
ncbi:MAG: DNA translocase FtsK 4TM domain-containing protein [Pseudomonadota bacterium]